MKPRHPPGSLPLFTSPPLLAVPSRHHRHQRPVQRPGVRGACRGPKTRRGHTSQGGSRDYEGRDLLPKSALVWNSEVDLIMVYNQWLMMVHDRLMMLNVDLEVSWTGGIPKTSILDLEFSIINQSPSIWGTPIYGNPHLEKRSELNHGWWWLMVIHGYAHVDWLWNGEELLPGRCGIMN